MLTHLDLFSGIGCFALGLGRAGFRTVGFCEIDPFCRAVLEKNFPGVWIHDDVRTLTASLVRTHCGGRPTVLSAGVPCQPASVAGRRRGSADERWLWPAFLRVVRETLPEFVLAENVPGFVGLKPHGLDWLIGELEGAGYQCLPILCGACDVGAPHRRLRVWIMGYATGDRQWRRGEGSGQQSESAGGSGSLARLADAARDGQRAEPAAERANWKRVGPGGDAEWADASNARLAGRPGLGCLHETQQQAVERICCQWPARPGEPQHGWEHPRLIDFTEAARAVERSLGAPVDGAAARLDRAARWSNRQTLKAAGNAVVWLIPYLIGLWMMQQARPSPAESEVRP